MEQVVLSDRHEGGIAVLTLNRPQVRNALSADVRDALLRSLRALEFEPTVRAVVIAGQGGHFCSGGDIRTMGETDPVAIAERMEHMCRGAIAVGTFPKPLVAAVAGHAAGAGVSLACLCDTVVAQLDARFTVSFLRIGLGPDWGLSYTLGERIGRAAARRLMLSREPVTATEGHRLGLVDVLSDDGTVLERAIAEARTLATGPPQGMAAVKSLMVDRDRLAAALYAEAALQIERLQSHEHAEGIAAFRAKRAPDFGPRDG